MQVPRELVGRQDPVDLLEVCLRVEAGADPASIAADCNLEPGRVRVVLGTLEARGLIRRSGIGSYEPSAALRRNVSQR